MWDLSSNLTLNIGYAGIVILVLIVDLFHVSLVPSYVFTVLSMIGIIPVAISAVKALIKRKLTIDLLASIALIFSFISGEWHSAAFINLMLSFARIFDICTETRTKSIISHLLKYRPEKVKIQRNNEVSEVPIEKVNVGDQVIIEAGERIPVDGIVLSGAASINESTLTGESELISKKTGSTVYSSTYNESGSLVVRADKIGKDSTLARIINLIEEASRKKAHTERTVDVFTQWYIIIMLVGSFFLFVLTRNASLVLSILLVVCADDIAVAVPLSFTVAIARGAKRGIIIKGSDVIEKLSHIKAVITDKTGTLTSGNPKILEVRIFGNHKEKQILEYLGIAAINSSHPVDAAIIKYVKENGGKIVAPDEWKEYPGDGLTVSKGKRIFHIGKVEFLSRSGIGIKKNEQSIINTYKHDGYSLSALSMGRHLSALAVFEDEVKPFARSVIAATKKLGVQSWTMITGDNEKVASHVARLVGIEDYRYNVTPEQKLVYTKEIKRQTSGVLAMVGDGVNDAAALALADVSFAMGAIGSDAAIEASDIALMNDKLERIPEAIRIAKTTTRIVQQNFMLWGITNALGLSLVLTGMLHPDGAATFNFVTDFFPIFNALRVGLYKPRYNT